MIVENVSVISAEDSYNCLYQTNKRNLMSKFLYAGFVILAGIGILVYGLYMSTSSWITMGGIFGAFGIAYAIYTLILILRSPKQIKENHKDICENGVTYSYKFREQGCDIVAKVGAKNQKVSYKYSDFKVVYEYDDRFELRLSTGEIMFVLKNAFADEKRIEFFKKNLGTNKKLKIKPKKK